MKGSAQPHPACLSPAPASGAGSQAVKAELPGLGPGQLWRPLRHCSVCRSGLPGERARGHGHFQPSLRSLASASWVPDAPAAPLRPSGGHDGPPPLGERAWGWACVGPRERGGRTRPKGASSVLQALGSTLEAHADTGETDRVTCPFAGARVGFRETGLDTKPHNSSAHAVGWSSEAGLGPPWGLASSISATHTH